MVEYRLSTRRVTIHKFWVAVDPTVDLNEAVAVAQSKEELLKLLNKEQLERCEITQVDIGHIVIKAPKRTGTIVVFIKCKQCEREFPYEVLRESWRDHADMMSDNACAACTVLVGRDRFNMCPYETYEFNDEGDAIFTGPCGLGWNHKGKCQPWMTKANFDSEMERITKLRREKAKSKPE